MTTLRKPHPLLRIASPVAFVFGTLLLVIAASMALPIACSIIYDEGDLLALVSAALITAGLGAPLRWFFKGNVNLNVRSAFFVATFGWVVVSAVSALPFVFHGSIPSFTDGFFEMMSGYTTTGSTILTDIEVVPHGLLLWRSETHFIGGMGFVTLAVLILPHGMGGLRLFRAESSPGQVITKERFTARNRDAMRYLWVIYTALNLAQILLYLAGGMSLFDSLCHAFGTVSTSGYSPYNASMGHYDSAYFDWVTTIFMFFGGMTFVLFFRMARGEFRAFRVNTEFHWYVGFLLFFCVSVSLILYEAGTYPSLADSFRFGSFQVVSILTTTGFTTADYELWPNAAQMFLYAVCFIGACAGSTTSGIKVVHYAIIWKFMVSAVKKIFFQPLAVVSVRLDGHRIDQSVIDLALCYFIVNIFLVLGGGMFMSLVDDMDFTTAMSSVIATLFNIGPGFGEVGPAHNFAWISDTGKWFLSANMLVGRLEMFSALVVLYPSFWRN
jgi:trk system potassium uptake protein TrkH